MVMLRTSIFALLTGLLAATAASAEEPVHAQSWSFGGAALANAEASRVTMWSDDESSLSAGVAAAGSSVAMTNFRDPSLQTGGFLAWQSSIYRVDATLAPNFSGQVTAGLAASVGAQPGELGTRYGLRIGTAWSAANNYSINPAAGYNLSELAAPVNNYNISFMINHALTPNLNLIGLAEAQRSFGPMATDNNNLLGRLVVGAGLGYRF